MEKTKRTKKIINTSILLVYFLFFTFTGGVFGYQAASDSNNDEPLFENLTDTFGYPSAWFEWEFNSADSTGNTIVVAHVSPVTFTGLSVGWNIDSTSAVFETEDFEVHIRTKETSGFYNEWHILHGEYEPETNPTGKYWSELYLTDDGEAHDEFEIMLISPNNADVNSVRVSVADTSVTQEEFSLLSEENEDIQTASSGLTPNIITREDWWGSLPGNQINSPDWLPEAISPSHVIIHHTATQNNPSNPAQAVRNIWHYHAITLEWGDIGYNFIIDQHGNIYQGRNNPWLDTVDTHAAHAGLSNSKSFGVSLLGQFESTVSSPSPGVPTSAAIASLEQLIGWRFVQYNLNPFDTATINTKRYGFINVPRICGHRDVAATSCPGDSLYAYMPSIRTNVDEIIKDNNINVFRLFGINRYQTAVEISQTGWPSGTENIVLARGDDYADALAGVPLAYQLDAPILLASNARLDDAVTFEIQRLQAGNVIILGGLEAISIEIEKNLEGLGLDVKRIAGTNRYETAVRIAEKLMNNGGIFDTAYITVGTEFADALSASSYAARQGSPILMTRTGSLEETTLKALVELGINRTVIVGGTAAVSDEVLNDLPDPRRIFGDNRYATSIALAEEFLPSDKKDIFTATGLDFPDAIAGAVLAAKENTGILLVRGDLCEPDQVIQMFISEKGINRAIILGGNSAVSSDMENWFKANLCQ